MESFMNLVASIHSHAERVSSAYYEARRNGMKHSIARSYELLFLGLSILAIAALINSGIHASAPCVQSALSSSPLPFIFSSGASWCKKL
jgi:hypothetical protein